MLEVANGSPCLRQKKVGYAFGRFQAPKRTSNSYIPIWRPRNPGLLDLHSLNGSLWRLSPPHSFCQKPCDFLYAEALDRFALPLASRLSLEHISLFRLLWR